MGKHFIKDSYTDKPNRGFDFKLFLLDLGFIVSKLDNLRYFRADGYNLVIVPGEIRKASLFKQNEIKSHVANFIIPEGREEALILFKSLQVIKHLNN